MNREIKFRAWDKLKNQMGIVEQITYGDTMLRYISSDGAIQGIKVFDYWFRKGQKDGWGNLDNLEIMQFTGLLDKNGKECFEGDVVKRVYGYTKAKKPQETIDQIVYHDKDGAFAFFQEYKGGRGWSRMYSGHKVLPWEVIGNVFENKNLIEPQP